MTSSYPPPALSGTFPAVAPAVAPALEQALARVRELACEIFRSVHHLDSDARSWLLSASYTPAEWRLATVLAGDALRCAEMGEDHALIGTAEQR